MKFPALEFRKFRVITYSDAYGGNPNIGRVDFDSMQECESHIYEVQMTEGTNVAIEWRNVDGKVCRREGKIGKGGHFVDNDGGGSDYGCPLNWHRYFPCQHDSLAESFLCLDSSGSRVDRLASEASGKLSG